MNVSRAKDELLDRVFAIDPEQFEQFCKILVEEIERPAHIELTPFNGDGGIDVRGHYGRELYHPQFGVQAKQFESNIGTPAMRNFVGALQQHHYQFGVFIATSEYASGAVDLAEDQFAQPITLVNRERLLDLLLDYQLGVIESGDDQYEIDPSFWTIFDKTTSDDPVQTDEVPQADSLDVLRYALMAIDQGYRYKPEITDYMERKTRDDWTPRQGDYYPSAGYALGYVHKDTMGEYRGRPMRQWGLTRDGQEYIELIQQGREDDAHAHLVEHIEDMEIIERVIKEIKTEGTISHSYLIEFIEQESELNDTTAERRASTIGNWLDELPYIARKRSRTIEYEYISNRLDDY